MVMAAMTTSSTPPPPPPPSKLRRWKSEQSQMDNSDAHKKGMKCFRRHFFLQTRNVVDGAMPLAGISTEKL